MSLPVFLIPSLSSATVGATVEVLGDEARHAVVVRRIKVGEQIALTDGMGTTVECDVLTTAEGNLSARVLELAVEILTEVGVDVIVPWAASRSIAVWRGERAAKSLLKWRATAREAAKQSRRSWFPHVAEMASTQDVVALLERAHLPVVLHEAASGPMADPPVLGRGEILIVVGPEGGISDEELAAFADVGAEPVRLGSSVLRTSTAGVAAAAALLSRTPRWR